MKYDFEFAETKKVDKEVELPFYAQDGCYFIMISEEETIVRIKPAVSNGIDIEMQRKEDICHKSFLKQALVDAKPITENEFMKWYNKSIDKINSIVLTPLIDVLP